MSYHEIRRQVRLRVARMKAELEATIARCSICGGWFFLGNNRFYCSPDCAHEAIRRQKYQWWLANRSRAAMETAK